MKNSLISYRLFFYTIFFLSAGTIKPMSNEELICNFIRYDETHLERFLAAITVDYSKTNFSISGEPIPLFCAVLYNKFSAAELLLKRGANPNVRNNKKRTPLMITINPHMIQLLLHYGADPNLQDEEGTTPLMLTTNPAIAQLLLSYGANPFIANKAGQTAQDICIQIIKASSDDAELGACVNYLRILKRHSQYRPKEKLR